MFREPDMTHGADDAAAQPAGAGPPPPAGRGEPDRDAGRPGHRGDAVALCQQVISRLFAAGLTLNSALALIRDGPAAARVHLAVAEIDAAVRDVRDLVFALPNNLEDQPWPAEGRRPAEGPWSRGPRAWLPSHRPENARGRRGTCAHCPGMGSDHGIRPAGRRRGVDAACCHRLR